MLATVYRPPVLIKRYNSSIRSASARILSTELRKGLNVLALEIHRAPHHPKAQNYSNCGLVTLELNCTGRGISKAGRPSGFQVCAVNPLTKITPWGCYWSGRITQGAGGYFCMPSLSWAPLSDTGKQIRMVGARNIVAMGQAFVSSDSPIRNLKVKVDDLIHTDGQQRIPASQVYVRYEAYPDEFPDRDVGGMLGKEPAFSYLDILLDKVPALIYVLQPKKGPPATWRDWKSYCEYTGCGSWRDGGVVVPIWIFVKIPTNVNPGRYNGRITISAESSPVHQLPISLAVSKWFAPNPEDISVHVGAVHSPDTLSIYYKTPLWSEHHWKLVETTLSYMGALGAKVLWLPLVADFAWFHNSESIVYWIKQTDGSYKLDFRVFDKYLDLVQKYMKPDVVCLCILDGGGYSVLDVTSGKIERAPMPPYDSSPQAMNFWKPLLEQTLARLEKRGLDGKKIVVGLLWEGASAMGGRDAGFKKESMELFKSLLPDLKLAQIAHYGANRMWKLHDTPIGYTMSVWGNKTGVKIKPFHGHELPVKVAWHPRCDNYNDIRPISARGSFLTAIERAVGECLGLGPVGMDFWNLADIPKGRGPRTHGSLEGCLAWNLSMSHETCAALLAPGPNGPVPTVRFELIRLGLYEAEARVIIERTLQSEEKSKKLTPELIAKCKDVLARRNQAMSYVRLGEGSIQGEGWKWFEASGWQDRTYELFECAADVVQALGAK